jgi:hypothetical protein
VFEVCLIFFYIARNKQSKPCKTVQKYGESELRIDKKDVAHLLKGFSDSSSLGLWPVAKSYRILGGVIYADDPEPEPFSGLGTFDDPDLFFSFARLGVRGEPSESSILRWVSEHGLLRRENEMRGPWSGTEVEQAPITVADFRAEVLCARQLLTLYMNIREEDFEALKSKIYETAEKRHLSSYWPHTPPTDLEKCLSHYRDVASNARKALGLLHEMSPFDEPEWTSVERWDVFMALGALQEIVRDRLADVRLDFDHNWTGTQPLGSDYRIPRSWDCPDLLSAMYLQFYLLITDFEPVRRCQNPACGLPFPATRSNRIYCNATCRSNARHYR